MRHYEADEKSKYHRGCDPADPPTNLEDDDCTAGSLEGGEPMKRVPAASHSRETNTVRQHETEEQLWHDGAMSDKVRFSLNRVLFAETETEKGNRLLKQHIESQLED